MIFHLNTEFDWYFRGMWQDISYFRGYEDIVRGSFVFREPHLKDTDYRLIEKIKSEKSVSIHVRRGDFIYDNSQFNICHKEYYIEAIKRMESIIGTDVKYFIFSDEPEFMKREFEFLNNKEVVIHDKTQSNIDMIMMSLCSHNIISNSTFSFWGAFLGNQTNRIVIAPRYCRINNIGKWEFSLPDAWIKLDV